MYTHCGYSNMTLYVSMRLFNIQECDWYSTHYTVSNIEANLWFFRCTPKEITQFMRDVPLCTNVWVVTHHGIHKKNFELRTFYWEFQGICRRYNFSLRIWHRTLILMHVLILTISISNLRKEILPMRVILINAQPAVNGLIINLCISYRNR